MLWKEWIKRGFGYQMGTYLAMLTLSLVKLGVDALNSQAKKQFSNNEETKTE